ncbi:hypothetical protein ACFLZZ_01765 [Nanoarchaeota archaeon]
MAKKQRIKKNWWQNRRPWQKGAIMGAVAFLILVPIIGLPEDATLFEFIFLLLLVSGLIALFWQVLTYWENLLYGKKNR